MALVEINFDGIIGPSHNYAGLSPGNIASANNAGAVSQPRAAALQGIEKMRANLRLGLAQGFFMPLDRPNKAWLAGLATDMTTADYTRNERDRAQPNFEHALFVKTQVISVQPWHAVCDAGHKSHAIDSGLPRVHGIAGLEYCNGGDEHGILRATGPGAKLPLLGDSLWLVPGHCDPTVNLHDYMIGVSGGLHAGSVERIVRVDARGAIT